MTHAHDRTLLAKMGFADPDKRNGLHDDLCAYLASKDASLTLVREVGKRINWLGKRSCDRQIVASGGSKWCSFEVECSRFKNPTVKLEHALVKGHGQYATTVGFFDVYLEGILLLGDCPDHGEKNLELVDIIVEVKAGKVSPSDLLRQINLYRSIPTSRANIKTQWVVFTGFRYGADDAALLEREGIHVFCAGAKFEAWQRARSETQAADGGTEI